MRIFIAVLVLILNLQSWTKADDIRDFEIEGMSIGDSALVYFSENELSNKDDLVFYSSQKNKLFKFQTYSHRVYEKPKKFLIYDNIAMHFTKNDTRYIIKSVSGILYFRNDLINFSGQFSKPPEMLLAELPQSLPVSSVFCRPFAFLAAFACG